MSARISFSFSSDDQEIDLPVPCGCRSKAIKRGVERVLNSRMPLQKAGWDLRPVERRFVEMVVGMRRQHLARQLEADATRVEAWVAANPGGGAEQMPDDILEAAARLEEAAP